MKINAGTNGIAQIITSQKNTKAINKKLKIASKVYACVCCQNQY